MFSGDADDRSGEGRNLSSADARRSSCLNGVCLGVGMSVGLLVADGVSSRSSERVASGVDALGVFTSGTPDDFVLVGVDMSSCTCRGVVGPTAAADRGVVADLGGGAGAVGPESCLAG